MPKQMLELFFIRGRYSVTLVDILFHFAHKIPHSIDLHSPRSSLRSGLCRGSVRIPPGATNSNTLETFVSRVADLCAGRDSNLRRHKPGDLQSPLVDRLSTDAVLWLYLMPLSEQ